jgi:hypothetical protein
MIKKFKKKNITISYRHYLIYKAPLIYNNILDRDPLNKLINDISEIEQVKSYDNIKIISILYFNRKKIEKILYEKGDIFLIQTDSIENRLSDYFYLSLLIQEDPEIMNYNYSIDLIEKINNINNKKDINYFLEKLMVSKIIIELIDNYENYDFYDEKKEGEILKKIEEDNSYIIQKNLYSLKELEINWSIDDIKEKKIDEIYAEIIIALIKTKKIDNSQYSEVLLNQLDFKNIIITEKIFDKLSDFFKSNEQYIKDYNMDSIHDLENSNKQNFYYLLLVFILKDSFYIYQIPFLYQIRKRLLINFKKKESIEKNEKINEILKIFDLNDKIIKQNSLNASTKNNSVENDKNEITYFIEKILNNSTFILNKNNKDRKFYLRLLDDKKQEDKNTIKRKKKEEKKYDKDMLEKNFIKLLDFLKTFLENIQQNFLYKYNLLIKLIIKSEGKNKTMDHLDHLLCTYIYYPPNETNISSFIDDNILVNGINTNNQGFFFLLNDINKQENENITYKSIDIEKIIKERDKKDEEKNNNRINEIDQKPISLLDIPNNVSKYKIIEFKAIIASHSLPEDNTINTAEFIKQLSYNFFISGGKSRYLYIYNKDLKIQQKINLKDYPTNIFEIKNNNENSIRIIICSNDNNKLITYKINNDFYHLENQDFSSSLFIEMNEKKDSNKYIISNIQGTFFAKKLSASKTELNKKLDYNYKVGIKISEKIFALASNSIVPNGADKLIVYNLESKEIIYEIEGKSFSICMNSLLLIENQNKYIKEKLLVCACKKYLSYQRNEILLINIKDNEDSDEFNFDTNDFAPNCFCNIYYIYNNNSYQTNYIFVGGYNTSKREGEIQLYKIKYNNNKYILEFMQNLIFDNESNNFSGFDGAITCITQSKITGDILITSSNGNIYQFSPPNINYYLYYDEEEDLGYKYDEIIFNNVNKSEKNEEKKPVINNRQFLNQLLKLEHFKKYSNIFE